MIRLLSILLLLLSTFGAMGASGQATSGSSEPRRYLFIVETSKTMGRRTEGLAKCVNDFLLKGFKPELQPGDSLGLWTFNQKLLAGKMPLQTWPAKDQNAIPGNIINFLQLQKFEKAGQLESVMPDLAELVNASQYLTVILISSGEGRIKGTPFDQQINKSFALWRGEQEKARMPFVTILRVFQGKIAWITVNPAQWPLDLPPSVPRHERQQPLPVVAKTSDHTPANVASPVPAGALIFSGKNPASLAAEPIPHEKGLDNSSAGQTVLANPTPVLSPPSPANSVMISTNNLLTISAAPVTERKTTLLPLKSGSEHSAVAQSLPPKDVDQQIKTGTVSLSNTTARPQDEVPKSSEKSSLSPAPASPAGTQAIAPKNVGTTVTDPQKPLSTSLRPQASIFGVRRNVLLAVISFGISLFFIFLFVVRLQKPGAHNPSLISRSMEAGRTTGAV
jgi:hypothetical protein